MRRLIYFLLLALVSTSCSMSKLEQQAFDRLRPELKDPDSYRLISIEAKDTLSEYDNAENALRHHEYMYDETLAMIEVALRNAKVSANPKAEFLKVDEYMIDLKTDSVMMDFLDDKVEAASKSTICAIKYVYRFRCINDNGVEAPQMYYFWADTKSNVIQFAKEEQELSDAPSSISGYDDLLASTLKKHQAEKQKLY